MSSKNGRRLDDFPNLSFHSRAGMRPFLVSGPLVPERLWRQHFSGARALFSGISTFPVPERLWRQHFFGIRAFLVSHLPTLMSMNNLVNVLSSGQVRVGGRDTSINTFSCR
jgi:hypothetical protein